MKQLAPDQLKDIALRLQTIITSGLDQKSGLTERWRRSEEFYDNAPVSGDPQNSKMVRLHEPFLQPRIDQLSAMVCGVVTKQEPYMLARDLKSGERSERLEQTLHFFWQREPASFEKKARRASTIAAITNKAVWKLSWQSFDATQAYQKAICEFGLTMEVIHPDHFVCVPAIKDQNYNAKLIGNLIIRRRRWVTDKQANGEFLDYEDREIPTADVESSDHTGTIMRSRAQAQPAGREKDDDEVKIWDLVVRLDLKGQDAMGQETGKKGKEELYHVMLAIDDPCILLMEPYPYSRPMYFESYYVEDERNYWSGRSVAYNLQGPQEIHDLLFGAGYNAIMAEALPLVLGAGLPEKFTKYGWGDVVNVDDMVNPPWSPPARFGGAQAIGFFIQENNRTGDQAARVSQNTMGSTATGQRTATEQSIVASGVSAGQEEYIANFSNDFPSMAAATCEILEANFDEWYSVFGYQEMMGPDGQPVSQGFLEISKEDLSTPVVWEPTGKTPGNTPQAKMQAAQMLVMAGAQLPQMGFDLYKLGTVLVNASGLNADQVQKTEQQMQEEAMQQQQMMMQQQAQEQGMQQEQQGQQMQGQQADGDQKATAAHHANMSKIVGDAHKNNPNGNGGLADVVQHVQELALAHKLTGGN
jgi:hypothetical protein